MSTIAAATPDHASSSTSGDAVSDKELGADILFGFLVGTPLIYVTLVTMCLVAGTGLGNALLVSILPCALSGVFFGGVLPLSRQMARHETAERNALRPVAPLPTPVDAADVAPAA